MKKTKRLLAAIITAVILFSFSACNNNNVSSRTIILSGKSFELPIKGSELLEQGFSMKRGYEEYEKFKPNTTYSGLEIEDSSGNTIHIDSVLNGDKKKETGFEKCRIYKTELKAEEISSKKDFVLPGGITLESTYEDIIKTYGDEKDNPNFKKVENYVGKTDGSTFGVYYSYQKSSNYRYVFEFDKDEKTLNKVEVSLDY